MATLFSYFTKTPKSKSPNNGDLAEVSKNKSPTECAGGFPSKGANKKGKLTFSQPCVGRSKAGVKTELLEIVWGKMDGHPIWPCIICKHPTLGAHLRDGECHVQFFGDPPSRGWVKLKQLQPFVKGDSKGGVDPSVKKAISQANGAMSMSMEDREKLISCIPSDEEDEIDAEMECDNVKTSPSNDKENQAASSSDEDEDDVTGRKYNSKRPRRKSTARGVKKRKRISIESGSDSSGSEDFKPESEESDESVSSGVEEEKNSTPSENEEEDDIKVETSRKRKRGSTSTPLQKKGKLVNGIGTPQPKPPPKASATPILPSALASKINNSASKAATSLAKFQMASSPAATDDGDAGAGGGTYRHEKLEWLKESKRKDMHGRPMSHPEYDPKTLLVPQSYLTSKEVTPAMRQWWQLKSEHFDTVLFFKVGKFYELYHMDATTGVKELNLIYMKGNFAHAGFPEIAFGRYSDTLIQKGYKIARVEQTETPEMMRERCKKERTNSKFDQVVKREICAVTTKGTKMYSFRDGDCTESEAAYLLAIAEKGSDDSTGGESCYGVCFLDTSIGKFHLGQFKDDRQASRLRTLVAHHTPVQVLCCRGGLTTKTQHILSHELMSALTEHLAHGSEFWDASKTLKFLAEGGFFQADKDTNESAKWPEVLKQMANGDPLGLTASDDYDLALSALGALVWYLKKCLIEEELLSMAKFEEYKPLDVMQTQNQSSTFGQGRQHMILDDVTLANLDILPCGPDVALEGTLLERLDHCSTSFGKRLFKQWLCAPLCNPSAINDRLNAIEDLMSVPAVVADVKEILKGLPDLERLLRKIHSLGSLKRAKDHPDGRAILYNEDTYSKRKIADFLSALEGIASAKRVVKLFKEHVSDFKSKLLRQIVTLEAKKNEDQPGGRFPHLDDRLRFFQYAFDHNKAKKDGVILPGPGVHMAYDEALHDIKVCKSWFDQYLDQQRKRLACRAICYWGSAKNRFQLEVPESALAKHTPDEYSLQSQKKGFRRYWTPDIERQLVTLTDAEDRRDAALKDTMRNVFQTFDEDYDIWDKAVQCLAVLDAILSLTTYSSHGEGTMCRPEVVLPEVTSEGDSKPFLEIREGRHPCISRTFTGDDFIPNDTVVGISNDGDDMEGESAENADSTCVLVTGPNMGGKSTLMRQAGLITVMAQLGCYVPAESCRLTPVDRVFTRLGAHDRILAGESTFFVELSETATILRHSTRHSLVLLDELGRGTATYDGTAIACAVVRELSANIRCRTLFSTHYHSLVEEFATDPNVRLGHMACMVENDDEEGDPSKETITFLYKFVKGDCPKSYGFNAARLAGIPDEIISVAVRKSRQFEETLDQVKIFRKILDKSIMASAKGDLLSLRNKIKL